MEKLMEKLRVLLNDLFEEDLDEEEKVEIKEDTSKTMKDQPVEDQPSLGGKALLMLDLVLSV